MRGFLSVAAVALIACTTARATVPIEYQVEPRPAVIGCAGSSCTDSARQVEITYLGVGGVMVRYRGHVLLTAPFYSTPSLNAVLRNRVQPDPILIERLLPRAADSASAILVGHSHYDHLLDVPYIATRRARGAMIYGSPSMRNILLGDPQLKRQPERLVAFDSARIATIDRAVPWTYTTDSAFRFMPIRAQHGPTVRLLGRRSMFADGMVDRPLDTLPERADGWKLGEQLSYLIDVLSPGDATPVLRIYFEDAPNRPPLGFPPRSVVAARRTDVAILCAATATNVPDTPGAIASFLQPRFVIVSHWEDFFRPQTLPIKLNPFTDTDAFMDALSHRLPAESKWWMPIPRMALRFAERR
jgi:hypothetical protein